MTGTLLSFTIVTSANSDLFSFFTHLIFFSFFTHLSHILPITVKFVGERRVNSETSVLRQ